METWWSNKKCIKINFHTFQIHCEYLLHRPELICNLIIYFDEFNTKRRREEQARDDLLIKRQALKGLECCRFVNIFCHHCAMSSLMWPYWEMPIGISASPSSLNSNTFSTAMLNTLHKCSYHFPSIACHFNSPLCNVIPICLFIFMYWLFMKIHFLYWIDNIHDYKIELVCIYAYYKVHDKSQTNTQTSHI